MISIFIHSCIFFMIIYFSQRNIVNDKKEMIVYVFQEENRNVKESNIAYNLEQYEALNDLNSNYFNSTKKIIKKDFKSVFFQKPKKKPNYQKTIKNNLSNISNFRNIRYEDFSNSKYIEKFNTKFSKNSFVKFENSHVIKLGHKEDAFYNRDSFEEFFELKNYVLRKNSPIKNNYNPIPTYPRFARVNGIEGLVLLEVSVNSLGYITDIFIKKTSGHTLLDRAAYSAVKNWLFIPAVRNGKNINSKIDIPVRFSLRDS